MDSDRYRKILTKAAAKLAPRIILMVISTAVVVEMITKAAQIFTEF